MGGSTTGVDSDAQYRAAELAVLSAYVPEWLLSRALADPTVLRPGAGGRLYAAIAFADIAGFTALAERLATTGREGAEELTALLNRIYTALLDAAARHGGGVAHFGGDAMTVLFPAGGTPPGPNRPDRRDHLAPAVLRALRGARAMQDAFDQFRHLPTRAGPIHLTMEVGVSAGRVLTGVVGRPEMGLEFVVAGRAVDRAAAVERQAPAGTVHLDGELVPLVSRQAALGGGTALSRSVLTVTPAPPRPDAGPHRVPPAWAQLDDDDSAVLVEALRPFVPPGAGDPGQWTASGEHRRITTAFLEFSGLDYDRDAYPLHKLHAYFCQVQEALAPFGGRVNRVLTGDKGSVLHLLFGAPVAHEDDAARALRALLYLRTAGDLPFAGAQRAGVATGPVFAGALGSPERREYTVLGTTVNRASRLTEVAAPGQTLLDAATAERTPSAIQLIALPPQELRGLGEPVALWSLEREDAPADDAVLQRVAGRAERAPLVGRAAELSQVEALMALALAGQGQVLFITGEAGIGKSRLAEELLGRWMLGGGVAYAGAAQAYGAGGLYQPWIALLRDFCDLRPGLDGVEQASRLISRVTDLAPNATGDLPLLAQLLGVPLGAATAPAVEHPLALPAPGGVEPQEQQRRERRDALIVALLIAAARPRPLLLLFDGLQWADPASLALIDRVAQETAGAPLLLCLEARAGALRDLVALRRPNAHTLTLGDLPPGERAVLLQALAAARQRPLDPALAELIQERSQGNPFFIEELLVALDQGAAVAGAAPAWPRRAQPDAPRITRELNPNPRTTHILAPEPAPVRVPDSIEGVVMARLDSLGDRARQVVRLAAVLGAGAPRAALRQLVPTDLADDGLDRILGGLVEADLLRLDAESDSPIYRFRHHLTRQVAYESLPYAERRRLHGAAGVALEALANSSAPEQVDLLAYHFGLSNLAAKGRAYLERAGDRAAGLFALPQAAAYYEQALAPGRWPEGDAGDDPDLLPRQIALQRKLGRVRTRTGDYTGAAASFQRALDLCTEPAWEERVAIACELAWLYEIQGDYAAALQACQSAEAELVQHPPNLLWGQVRVRLAGVLFRRGQYGDALVALNAAVPMLMTYKAYVELGAAYNMLGNICLMRGDLSGARTRYEASLALAQAHDDLWGMAVSYNNLGNACWGAGQLIAARDYYEQSLTLREQMGDPGGAATVYTGLAATFWQIGELAEARRCADMAVTLAAQVGRVESSVLALIEQATLLETEGVFDAAQARLTEAQARARQLGSAFLIGRTGLGFAQVALGRGDLAAAQAALATWGPQVGEYAELAQIWLLLSAEVALAAGQHETALGLLTQVAAAASHYQTRFVWCRAARLLGELALQRGDPLAAVTHARQARTLAERMPAWIELAQTLDLLARAYAVAPTAPGALPPAALWTQAISILEECGATRFLPLLQARLAAGRDA